jgi:hypothetical protein
MSVGASPTAYTQCVKKLKRFFLLFNLVVGAIAVYEQMQRPAIDRTWHGKALGLVPHDFRPPNPQRFMDAWWNADDPRLFTPRDFGIGWAINLNRLYHVISGDSHNSADDSIAS